MWRGKITPLRQYSPADGNGPQLAWSWLRSTTSKCSPHPDRYAILYNILLLQELAFVLESSDVQKVTRER